MLTGVKLDGWMSPSEEPFISWDREVKKEGARKVIWGLASEGRLWSYAESHLGPKGYRGRTGAILQQCLPWRLFKTC